ncbi:hypothetical protein [Oceanobacillus senegalensis]|uniref:hypothetical protein n=1 Tax=Oceanobacillus senegalensis TaxID=1936063 RepID=UPI001C4E8963|nr:hypothetical protein [Oceanobacillus senegalensis]
MEEYIIFLLAAIGGLNVGDMIFQLIFFIVFIAIVVMIIALPFQFNKKNKRLKNIEEKLDKLLSEKENN